MKRTMVSLCCVVLVSSCAVLRDLLASAETAFQQPDLTFKSVALSDISLGGLTLDTVWSLNNPNNVALSLASLEYALLVEDKQVVSGAPAQGLNIAAQGSSELHFPAAIKFADLAAVVETFLTKDTASWKAQGTVGVNTPIGVIRLPLSKDGVFEIPKVPAVALGNPKVTNLSFTGATLEFPLTVTNKNSYPLPVGELAGALTLGGKSVGTISTGSLGELTGKGTKAVSIPLTLNFLSGAAAVAGVIAGQQAQVSFDAQVRSGDHVSPVNVNQLVNLLH